LTQFFLGQKGDYSKEINSTIKFDHVLRRLKESHLYKRGWMIISIENYQERKERGGVK